MQHAKNLQTPPPKKTVDSHQKKERRWKNYVKLQGYCLFNFQQVKLIEDEWFSFLKFIKFIHSAWLATWLSKKTPHPPTVETVKNEFFQANHTLLK